MDRRRPMSWWTTCGSSNGRSPSSLLNTSRVASVRSKPCATGHWMKTCSIWPAWTSWTTPRITFPRKAAARRTRSFERLSGKHEHVLFTLTAELDGRAWWAQAQCWWLTRCSTHGHGRRHKSPDPRPRLSMRCRTITAGPKALRRRNRCSTFSADASRNSFLMSVTMPFGVLVDFELTRILLCSASANVKRSRSTQS